MTVYLVWNLQDQIIPNVEAKGIQNEIITKRVVLTTILVEFEEIKPFFACF